MESVWNIIEPEDIVKLEDQGWKVIYSDMDMVELRKDSLTIILDAEDIVKFRNYGDRVAFVEFEAPTNREAINYV